MGAFLAVGLLAVFPQVQTGLVQRLLLLLQFTDEICFDLLYVLPCSTQAGAGMGSDTCSPWRRVRGQVAGEGDGSGRKDAGPGSTRAPTPLPPSPATAPSHPLLISFQSHSSS